MGLHVITITNCQEEDSGYEEESQYKIYKISLTIDDTPYTVHVAPFCGEYEYEDELPEDLAEDDEPIQVAIGEYFSVNNIDTGTVGR